MKKHRKLIILTFVGTLIYSGMNFGHPVTPAFLKQVEIDERYFGILFSTMAFSLALFSPFWGNKGDNYGRKWIIAIGICGYGIGQLFFGFGSTLPIILTGRIIAGCFAAAIFSNLIASFSEISTDKTRARNISIITSTAMVAGSLGYYIGGKLGIIFSPSTTIIIQGFWCITIAVIILLIYPKTATIQKERRSFIKNMALIKNIDEHIIYLMFAVLLFTFSQNNTAKFFDVFLNNNGYTSEQIGTFIMIIGIISAFVLIFIVPILARRFKLLHLMRVILVLMIVFLVVTFTINIEYLMYITYLIYAILVAMYISIEQTYITKNISSNYGAIIGVRESFKSIGLVTGPLVITFLFENISSKVFYFNAIVYFIALLVLIKFIKVQKSKF